VPRLTLIAGPDGAGKSTLARQAGFDGPFANADNHARDIDPEAPEAAAVAAGRETLAQLAMLIRGRRDVVYETTLSGTNALRVVDRAKAAGYSIEAVFVAIPSADLAIGRVAQRRAAGGPLVPPADVRRRYERSFDNLPRLVARADVTTIYDNTEKDRTVVARVEGGDFTPGLFGSRLFEDGERLVAMFGEVLLALDGTVPPASMDGEGGVSQGGEGLGGVARSGAAGVLAAGPIADVVQAVLDSPMPSRDVEQ
jgi:predicted ABC-type ATPase